MGQSLFRFFNFGNKGGLYTGIYIEILHALQWTLIFQAFLSFGPLFQALKIVRFEYCSLLFSRPWSLELFPACHELATYFVKLI